MSKKQEFIKELKDVLTNYNWKNNDAQLYWEGLLLDQKVDKPAFTDNGKLVIKFLQDNSTDNAKLWKSKDIADQIGLSSRTVAGGMRKLVNDGYVEKIGDSPSVYTLTDKGININVNSVGDVN